MAWPKASVVLHWWDKCEETLVGLLGLIALVIGLLQVIGRYFDPARAISYAEEVIVYLIIWAIMIVSSQLVRRDGHVRPDLVLRLLPPRYLRIMEIFNCLVAVVFCAALVWYGWEIVDTSLLIDETSSTDLQFPMDLLSRSAGGQRADAAALPHAARALCLLFRPRDHDGRTVASRRDPGRPALDSS